MISRRTARALGLVLCVLGCSREEAAPEAASAAAGSSAGAVQDAAPAFSLPSLDGGTVTLASLRGQTVILDFWATWCPPCEFQLPVLSEIAQAHRGRSVQVLGISVDVEGPDTVKAYLEKHPVSYTILLGSESLAREYGAQGFPALIVIRPDGSIHSRHVGLIERDELEQIIAEVTTANAGG